MIGTRDTSKKVLFIFIAIVTAAMFVFTSCQTAAQSKTETIADDVCGVPDTGDDSVLTKQKNRKSVWISPIPPIDVMIPENTETATFALG